MLLHRRKRLILIGCLLLVSNQARSDARQAKLAIAKKPIFPAVEPGQPEWDVTQHFIPLRDIRSGGVARDAIPALSFPKFVLPRQTTQKLNLNDRVLRLAIHRSAKAYPIRILNWHEIVNNRIAGRPVLVSWRPLCGSEIVYDPVVHGRRFTFGVSGLLYRRNLLLYNRQTHSLWSQLGELAVTGPLAGTKLRLFPARETTWRDWRKGYPHTQVLSFQTGFLRDYRRDPYASFFLNRVPYLIVVASGQSKIYPSAQLKKKTRLGGGSFAGRHYQVQYQRRPRTAETIPLDGKPLAQFVSYLFDARTFFPKARVFKAK